MYHAIVRKRIRSLFDSLNAGDYEPILSQFAPMHEHTFIGHHALSGCRTTLASTRRWYDRLRTIFPDIRFELSRIDVRGGPWNTQVIVDWTETNSGADGARTYNRGVHIIQLTWGRTRRLAILTDTVELQRTLDRLAARGLEVANAHPVEDEASV